MFLWQLRPQYPLCDCCPSIFLLSRMRRVCDPRGSSCLRRIRDIALCEEVGFLKGNLRLWLHNSVTDPPLVLPAKSPTKLLFRVEWTYFGRFDKVPRMLAKISKKRDSKSALLEGESEWRLWSSSTKGASMTGWFLKISLRNYSLKYPKTAEIWPIHGQDTLL